MQNAFGFYDCLQIVLCLCLSILRGLTDQSLHILKNTRNTRTPQTCGKRSNKTHPAEPFWIPQRHGRRRNNFCANVCVALRPLMFRRQNGNFCRNLCRDLSGRRVCLRAMAFRSNCRNLRWACRKLSVSL